MAIKITDMTAAPSVDGTELLPASVSGAPRSVTPAVLKTYTVDQIEAIAAGTAVTGADKVFILQSGVLKPVDIDLVAQHAIDTIWGKGALAVAAADDVLVVKEGAATEQTMTLAVLATYITSAIRAALFNLATLEDGSGALATSDYLLVTQGTTGKRIQVSNLSTIIYASLVAHVTGKDAVTTPADADILYVIQAGVAKKMTLAQMATYIDATLTGSGTADYLAQWASATELQAGPAIVDSATGIGDGTDLAVPTTLAVRQAIDTREVVWIPASAMIPSETAGAGVLQDVIEYGTNDLTHVVLVFAGLVADSSAEFNVAMSERWDRGTIKAKVYWAPGDAGANVGEYVRFNLAGGAFSDGDALDAALGTAQSMDDQVLADDDLHVTPASAAITVGGTPALGDLLHFKLTRDYDYAGAGTAMDVDARVFGVLIQFGRDQEVSAW